MGSPHFKIDDSLIISRLQYKELLEIKPDIELDAQFFPLVTSTKLVPFFDNLPQAFGFLISSVGSRIVKVKLERGYFRKGIERELSRVGINEAISLIACLKPKAPIFYQIALAAAFDELYEQPAHKSHMYAVGLEISRIIHHTGVIKDVLFCLNLFSLAELAEIALRLFEKFEGSFCRMQVDLAVGPSINSSDISDALRLALQIYEELHASLMAEEYVKMRLSKKFVVSVPTAAALGLTGLFLRSNRHYADLRQEAGKKLYQSAPKISVAEGGDALARLNLRFLEINASITWLKEQLLQSPNLEKPTFALDADTIKKPLAFGEIEGPEGSIKVSLFVNQQDQSIVYRIRSPAYFIAQAIPQIFRHHDIEDLGLLLFSLGISAEEVDL